MKKMTPLFLLLLSSILSHSPLYGAVDCDEPLEKKSVTELDAERLKIIHEKIFPQLPLERMKIVGGMGRVDVMPAVDFSYYIQTEQADVKASETLLIPMATSRLSPGYVSTPEWWDANKAAINQAKAQGQRPPSQDLNEVKAWLRKTGLSTNPFVYTIRGETVTRTPLQDYLLKYITDQNPGSQDVVLFRGAERATELADWGRGYRAKGARYWTPNANYAWRYARKDKDFLAKLVTGQSPLIQFVIPKRELSRLVREGKLILGTELTQRAHMIFDQRGVFEDHLAQSDFMGEGQMGVEIEIRATSLGADEFTKYFRGSASIDDLTEERVSAIREGTARLQKQQPWRSDALEAQGKRRIARTVAEAEVLNAIAKKEPKEEVTRLFNNLPQATPELVNVDGTSLAVMVSNYSAK